MVSVAFFFVYFVVKKSQLQKINFPQLSNFNPASTKKSIFAFQKKVDLMSRILAIGSGGKRVGLAVTDTLQMIANGLDAGNLWEDIYIFEKLSCQRKCGVHCGQSLND